jgi:hypothetical protein
MTAAGVAIILLGAGAALMPAEERISSDVVGALLLAGGLIEIVAGALRRETRFFAMLAGAVTAAAGLVFLLNDGARFFPTINVVIAWLVVRAVLLFATSARVHGAVRRWTMIAGATDLLLGLITLVGLSLASAVVLIFGPTPAMVASFAWVLALSFAVTGILLLQIASCERDSSL